MARIPVLAQDAVFAAPTDLPSPIPRLVDVLNYTQNSDYTVPITVSAPELAWTPPSYLPPMLELPTTVPVLATGILTTNGTGNIINSDNTYERVYKINEHANQMLENLICLRVLWHDLEDFRYLSFKQEDSSLCNRSKLEILDEFIHSFNQICDSIVVEAHRLVDQPQGGEETCDVTNLKNKIRRAAHVLEQCQKGDSELSTNAYEKNDDLFSTLISQERLLSEDLAQWNNAKAEENRRKLVGLYTSFQVGLKKVLVRLGLDEAIGTLVTLPLHRAIRLDDAQTLRLLLRCGASPYSADYIGRTALHVAAENNTIQMVKVLQSSSADLMDLDLCDIFGRSVLYVSIQAGHTELVRKLLALRGNEQRKDSEWRNLHVLAARSGNVALVRILLLAYGDLSRATDMVRSAGLIAAASRGHLEIVQLFVAANADLDGTAGEDIGALGVAVKTGHQEIISFLLSVNTNIDARRDCWVMAPIHYSIERGDSEIFDMMLKAGADINASFACVPFRMTTAVEFASEIGNLHPLRRLLELPELTVNRKLRARERSPLELAARKGHGSAVDLLLSHGADVNIFYRRHRNTTPLLEAVSGGHLSITKALIEAGADVNAFYSKDEGCYKTMSRTSALASTTANFRMSNHTETNLDASNMSQIEEQVECKIGDEGKESDEEELEDIIKLLESSSLEDTALQLAARLGNIEIIQILLKIGADVNALPQCCGRTALQYAALEGHLEIVELLLGAGAAVQAEGGKMTALQGAAKSGHWFIAELLLRRKAEVDATSRNSHEGTPLQLAAKGGHLCTVRLLLDWHADINCQSPGGNATPLQAAAYRGRLEVVRILLETGATVDAHPGGCFNGEILTALQAAAHRQHIDVVRVLLVAGADPNASSGTYGWTALGCAAANGNLEITKKLLIAGAIVDLACDSGGPQCTALQRASQYGHVDIARLLLRSSADPNAPALGDSGMTTLQGAARIGHLELTSILLEAGVDVNGQPSPKGSSALSYSLGQSHQNIARLLIDAGADVNATSEHYYDCTTALQIAAGNGLRESVDRLVYMGANLNAISRGGETALSIAIQNNELDVVYRLLEVNADVNIGLPLERAIETNQTAIVKLLLGKKADINAVYGSGFGPRYQTSAMERAVSHGSLQVMQLLLDAGTNHEIIEYSLWFAAAGNHPEKLRILLAAGVAPNAVNRRGDRALRAATRYGHLEIVCLLLDAGVDPNSIDNYGSTALSNAAECDHLEVVRSLLLAGADANYKSTSQFDDRTALHFAAARGRSEMIRLLLIAGADRHATTTYYTRLSTATEQNALDLAILSGTPGTIQILRDASRTMPQGPSQKRKRVEIED